MSAHQAAKSKVGRDAPCHIVAPGLRATVVDAHAVPSPSHSCEHPHVACPRGSAEEADARPVHKVDLDGQRREDIHVPVHGSHVEGHAAVGATLDHDAGARREGFVRQLQTDDLAERHPRCRGDPPELIAVLHSPRSGEDGEEGGCEVLCDATAQNVRHQLDHVRQFVSEDGGWGVNLDGLHGKSTEVVAVNFPTTNLKSCMTCAHRSSAGASRFTMYRGQSLTPNRFEAAAERDERARAVAGAADEADDGPVDGLTNVWVALEQTSWVSSVSKQHDQCVIPRAPFRVSPHAHRAEQSRSSRWYRPRWAHPDWRGVGRGRRGDRVGRRVGAWPGCVGAWVRVCFGRLHA